MNICFESLVEKMKAPVLQIEENGRVIARGFFLPEAIATLHDNGASSISYSDTGVFILFKGSFSSSTEEKCKSYIDEHQRTNREILFQSRNAAAQFVLGDKGRTNHWIEEREFR